MLGVSYIDKPQKQKMKWEYVTCIESIYVDKDDKIRFYHIKSQTIKTKKKFRAMKCE